MRQQILMLLITVIWYPASLRCTTQRSLEYKVFFRTKTSGSRVPGGIAAGLKCASYTSAWKRRRIRFLLNKLASLKRSIPERASKKESCFFSSTTRHWLKPVCKMRCALCNCPRLRCCGHGIGRYLINFFMILDRRTHLFKYCGSNDTLICSLLKTFSPKILEILGGDSTGILLRLLNCLSASNLNCDIVGWGLNYYAPK